MSEVEQHTESSEQLSALQKDIEHHRALVAHFQCILQSIPDGLICTDRDGTIFEVNASAEKLLGCNEKELAGETPEIFYKDKQEYKEQKPFWFPENRTAFHSPFEARFINKQKGPLSVEILSTFVTGADGELLCYLSLIRDISKRKELENRLRKKESTFRTVADFTYDWEIWSHSDGTFRYISPSCERITGYSPEEFKKNSLLFETIIHEEDKGIWEKHHHENLNHQLQHREIQFRIKRKNDTICWIEHACQTVIGKNDEILGYRSSNRDITKRKKFEDELSAALLEIELYKEQLEAESSYLQEEIKLEYDHDSIIGTSNALQYVLYRIERIARTDTTVLLLGETGTGKELFARAIHNTSNRKNRPMVKINCANLPANLIESELFGHERGAFSSADSRQIGRFELADKGAIFLDEIGEMPVEVQAKLLRILQEGEFERLGGSKTLKVDVRIIAATNRDLEEDVRKGRFRKDLWYRLNVYPITAPPLRDRVEDIPLLVRHFIDRFARKQGKKINFVPPEVYSKLKKYSWPGNIRELENVIERSVINTERSRFTLAENLSSDNNEVEAEFQTLEELERSYITRVLQKTNWKVSGKNSAAEVLGLKRSTLRAKIDKYKISRSDSNDSPSQPTNGGHI